MGRISFLLFTVVCIFFSNSIKAQSHQGIIFIENKGQWAEEVKFAADIPGGKMFIEETSLTYSFANPDNSFKNLSHAHLLTNSTSVASKERHAMKVEFVDAGSRNQTIGVTPLITTYNYFLGSDTTQWASGVKGYKKVFINDIYEGIDLEISSDADRVKYDFKLAIGANPNCIQMQYDGTLGLEINEETLQITTPYHTLTEVIPASYASCGNRTRNVESRYKLEGKIVSFDVNGIEPDESLVIDPLLIFSTYSGSMADNWGNTATYDENGNGYAAGMTNPSRGGTYLGEFPATSGVFQEESGGGWDVAILKFDSAGQDLLYATHLGGSGTEVPQSLLVNEAGELLVLGITGSTNFPVTSNAYDQSYNGGTNHQLMGGVDFQNGADLFVAKLSADGTKLLASTFIGGSLDDGRLEGENPLARNYGDESRGDINFDSQGNIIISSRTSSTDFPMTNGFDSTYNGGITDALVFKLSKNLEQLIWSTYLGGSGTDVALSVKVDFEDNIFVAGGTTSADFPTTPNVLNPTYLGEVDGWVAHLLNDGSGLISSSYVGTPSYDQVFFLDIDSNNEVYLAGQTEGLYPISSGIFTQGTSGQFIHKVSANLENSIFSTVINSNDSAIPSISLTAFLVNDCNNIYMAGWGSPAQNFSNSGNNNFQLNTNGLPVSSDAFQPNSDGSSFYLMVLSGDASELLYATHLGDQNSLVHVDGGTSRFDKHGIVYHSVCASCSGDSSFPTTDGAWSEKNGSIGCNNALFKFDLASLRARIQTNNLVLDDPGLEGGCLPLDIVFENFSIGGEIYEWNFGDSQNRISTTLDTIIHTYKEAGVYSVSLRATDPNTCISEDYAYTTITVSDPNFTLSDDVNICQGSSIQLYATGGSSYHWFPITGLSNGSVANPIASPNDTTTYVVEINNINGCKQVDSVTVNVVPSIEIDISIEQLNLCEGSRKILVINNSINATNISWDFGDGTIQNEWKPNHEYLQDGEFVVSATIFNEVCEQEFEQSLNIKTLFIPNVLTRNNDGKNDFLEITSAYPVDIEIFSRWGKIVYKEDNYANSWNGEGLTNGVYYYQVILKNDEVCRGWVQLLDEQ